MWQQIRRNQRNSVILVIVVAAMLFALGWFLAEALEPGAGLFGLGAAGVLWVIMSMTAFFGGRGIFLALGGARKIEKADNPQLWNVVEEMTIASGLSRMPDVYIIDNPSPNAFATGRKKNEAAVAVTTGLLDMLNRDELQGVIAHEIGHVKNRDVLYMIMIGVMVGAIVLLADLGVRALWLGGGRSRRSSSKGGGQAQAIIMLVALVLAILAPILAHLMYYACSRRREYLADASAAQFTRYPEGLASALENIYGGPKMERVSRTMAPMYIADPTRSAAGATSTHPPIEERIRILRSMGGNASFAAYNAAYQKAGHNRGIIAGDDIKDRKIDVRGAQEAGAAKSEKRDRIRQTTDMMWKLNKYLFIACACGTKLKVPPNLKVTQVSCPHCGRAHDRPQPTA